MADTKMQLVDWLDDLCVRFIINLPREELESVERICFQVEEAQWFYEDFIRPLDPTLPSLNLRTFSLRIFQHCPMLSEWSSYHHSAAFAEFLAYKTRVPVRGAIMLNDAMDHVVLVKGWKKSANWSFPRGKINKDEDDLDCAVREVYEETGFDIKGAGLVSDRKDAKFIEVTMREQHMRLYVFRNVSMDTHFEPRTRKEISKIEWYKLSDLPTLRKKAQDDHELATNANKFYMVAPFLAPLRKWIAQQKKLDMVKGSSKARLASNAISEDPETEGVSEVEVNKPVNTTAPLQTPSDLPEVSISRTATQQDASLHLKRLLKVGNVVPTPDDVDTNSNPNLLGSSTLMSLLREGPAAAEVKLNQNIEMPRTPMEQLSSAPELPRTPHHHHPHAPPTMSNLPPPPSYFPSDQGASVVHQQPRAGFPPYPWPSQSGTHPQFSQNRVQPSDLFQYPAHMPSVSQSFPQPNFPQPFHSAMQHPTPPPISDAHSQGPQDRIPAPYQRTGDPNFTVLPQFPNLHMPSIPTTSRLPPPALTSQSLALLNTLKGSNSGIGGMGVALEPAVDQSDYASIQRHMPNPPPGVESQGQAIEPLREMVGLFAPQGASAISTFSSQPQPSNIQRDPNIHHPQPPFVQQNLNILSYNEPRSDAHTSVDRTKQTPFTDSPPKAKPRPRSQHQENLLNLFRKPSVIDPEAFPVQETAPAELSANQSPLPSLQGGTIRIARRPSPKVAPIKTASPSKGRHPQDGRTSATVSGPLNLPQFDVIAKSAGRHSSGGSTTETIVKAPPVHPHVTILPRPSAAAPQPVSVAPETKPISPQREENKPTILKKGFQPQILRRPAQDHTATPQSVSQPPKSQVPAVKPTSVYPTQPSYDRRDSQSELQKKNLLSLFNMPASTGGPSPVSATNIKSPPVTSSPHSIVSPLQYDPRIGVGATPPGKARVGSLTSIVGNSAPSPATAPAPATAPLTPASTTSAEDKKFLLGFLGDFARGGQ